LEECNLQVLREAVNAEKPSLPFNAIERRVPFDGLARAGDGLHDECVKLTPEISLPPWHRSDVCLHGRIAIGLGNLRIAAGEELGLGL
jgi:hypothetical protein